jgi:hypothetical protein
MRREVVRGCYLRLLFLSIAAMALATMSVEGHAQHQGRAARQKPEQTRPAWRLRVAQSAPVTLSLDAVNAPLTEIAAEIGRKLNVPVILSTLIQNQRITLEFTKLPLEAALGLLAPQYYIDYVVGGDDAFQPKHVGIFLQAYNEAPPPLSVAGRKGVTLALVVEGELSDSEDNAKAETDDPPLIVNYEQKQLTVRARKQPIAVVLSEIAVRVGVPFDLEADSTEIVDASFYRYPLDQALRNLSPSARLYFRTGSHSSEITPLRIVLAAPAKS